MIKKEGRGRSRLLSLFAAISMVALPFSSLFITGAEAAPVAQASVFQGSGQSGAVDTTLSDRMIVQALDANGNPAAGVSVGWRIMAHPDGSTAEHLLSIDSMTDASGHAGVNLHLGEIPGLYEVGAIFDGFSPIVFDATAVDSSAMIQPNLTTPSDNQMLTHLGATLTWENPVGASQYEIRVVPANNDGPAIDLIRGIETSYTVEAPVFGQGNYVMLPGMTYTWQIRTTSQTGTVAEAGWSPWSQRTFRTPSVSSSTISLDALSTGNIVTNNMTPTLKWADSNPEIFYYEVQVSADASFSQSVGAPFLYWELRHGGVTIPMDSYTIPAQFSLQHNMTYYWRVRPRIQGDGTAVSWSTMGTFRTN